MMRIIVDACFSKQHAGVSNIRLTHPHVIYRNSMHWPLVLSN